MPTTRRVGRPPLSDEVMQERREAILRATLALVAELGAGNVRLRDVAARSGVSVGTLQYYFGSRDELLRDAFSQHARRVVTDLETAAGRGVGPWDRIHRLIETITESAAYMQRCSLWIEFAASSLRDPELRTLMVTAYEGWRKPLLAAVVEGTEAGLFRPLLPPEDVVSNALALIDGYELALALEISDVTMRQVSRQLRAVLAAWLGVTDDGVRSAEGAAAVTSR